MDWDDLRYFLAVGRAGTVSGAAKALGQSHSTIIRRVDNLESRLGVKLFDRGREGYSLTGAGEESLATAERMETEVVKWERQVAGRDQRPEGTVRLTINDTLMRSVLGPVFANLRKKYPGLVLELIVDPRALSISKRDADIAIRGSVGPPDTLIGRRIATIRNAVYGARGSDGAAESELPLEMRNWIGPDESLAELSIFKWMRKNVPEERVVVRSNSIMGILDGVRAGLGVAALPCMAGDSQPDLIRLSEPIAEMETQLWVLTHRQSHRIGRIRATMDVLYEELTRMRPLIEGGDSQR